MTPVSRATVRRTRRAPTGANVSASLQRWPTRNYFAELEPRSKDAHPIDELMDRHPDVRRLRRRARQLLARVQKRVQTGDVLDFEAERNHLDSTRVEVAYNLGFEGGLVLGRAEALRRGSRRAVDRDDRLLLTVLRAVLASTRSPPDSVEALLLEVAWAFAVGGGPPLGAEAITPRRRAQPGR